MLCYMGIPGDGKIANNVKKKNEVGNWKVKSKYSDFVSVSLFAGILHTIAFCHFRKDLWH